jgi:hypothetical protein
VYPPAGFFPHIGIAVERLAHGGDGYAAPLGNLFDVRDSGFPLSPFGQKPIHENVFGSLRGFLSKEFILIVVYLYKKSMLLQEKFLCWRFAGKTLKHRSGVLCILANSPPLLYNTFAKTIYGFPLRSQFGSPALIVSL